jgi:hypothetical protein
MRIVKFSIITLILSLAASGILAAARNYSMWLIAHPQAIIADSHSATTITAELRDSSGRTVPDGTIVDFTTSLGIIERRATTTAGVARVRLESGNTPGTALVSAVSAEGSAVAQLRVDFLEPGTELFNESFIAVSSKKHLGYDVDSQIVDSAGGVTVTHRGITIDAEEAQIDLKTNILRAKAKIGSQDIVIRRGERTLLASALFYDLTAMRGLILTPAAEGAKRMLFRGRDLFVEPCTSEQDTVNFEIKPIIESKMFIKCKSCLIRPGEEIKFKRAVYYVNGEKLLSVPLHVLQLRNGTTGTDQFLTYGTEGLRLNIPFYYSLTPSGTGTIRLKHSEPTGWGSYSDRAGWQIDIEQEYNSGANEGLFSVNRVTSSDWGIRWNHRIEFANDSQIYTYFDFPSHRDLYGTVDYTRFLRDYTFALSLRGNKLRNANGRYLSNAYLQSRAKSLFGNAVSYAFTARLSYAGGPIGSENRFDTGLGLQLYGKPLHFGPSTNVSTSLALSRDWGGSNEGTSVYANIGLYRTLGNFGSLNLNYSYSWADTAYGYNAQRISADLSLRPSQKWYANLYSIYGLGDRSLSTFGDLSYSFMRDWRIGFLSTYQKMPYFDYSDFEIVLAKALGRQEARLTWSQSRKKLRLEFSAAEF